MLYFARKWNTLSTLVAFLSLALISCEPGKSLDPTPAPGTGTTTGSISRIEVISAPAAVLPKDTAAVELSITDSATGAPQKAALLITSTQFSLLSSSSASIFKIDSVPDDGKVSFRIHSSSSGTGSITVRVTSGTVVSVKSIPIIVTEKPVPPVIKATFPEKVIAGDTTLIRFTIVDSSDEDKPLANAVVTVTSAFYTVFDTGSKDTLSTDTTGADGKAAFRILSLTSGTSGTLQVKVRTAAGITRTTTHTLEVAEDSAQDKPRKMLFTALRSSLRADGSDSTDLRVLVKDNNNNPMPGEKLRFTSTGGVVKAEAVTDAWGVALTTLRSERANKTVVVTATLVKTGATAQQSVAFDGVTITISPQKRILMKNIVNPVLFELKDGGNVPMSGDSLDIIVSGALDGVGQGGEDSIVAITDTKGQFESSVKSDKAGKVVIIARALGAKSMDTVVYTTNSLVVTANKSSINGDGLDAVTLTATLTQEDNSPIDNSELRWTTTFGTFTTSPFTSSSSAGKSTIVLRSPKGSGLAIVNVEAFRVSGGNRSLEASGTLIVPVKALKVARLELKVTPDNIPVKTGETRMIAQAYDSTNNVMTGVLVSFRMVKGAGGGDEVIDPPIDFTKAGQAEAAFKAGGVISLYRGVKLAAVALDISGGDTLIIASSDTVGLTISGPPHRISVGVNILKGENPNDGTFALPTAAVVTDVNGNLVADGTPVNFSTTPVGALYPGESWNTMIDWPYYYLGDTIWYFLPWTDYNNNKKLDPDEELSDYDDSRTKPYRGEDQDGNGVINFPPESFVDINHNGTWDSIHAEPFIAVPVYDTSSLPMFVDFNRNGVRDSVEYFNDRNGDGKCQCAGQRDASGALYEESYFSSTANHPFPGEVSVGIPRQILTLNGKATTKIQYVQSMARSVRVRITAEANGVRSHLDETLPIIKDDK